MAGGQGAGGRGLPLGRQLPCRPGNRSSTAGPTDGRCSNGRRSLVAFLGHSCFSQRASASGNRCKPKRTTVRERLRRFSIGCKPSRGEIERQAALVAVPSGEGQIGLRSAVRAVCGARGERCPGAAVERAHSGGSSGDAGNSDAEHARRPSRRSTTDALACSAGGSGQSFDHASYGVARRAASGRGRWGKTRRSRAGIPGSTSDRRSRGAEKAGERRYAGRGAIESAGHAQRPQRFVRRRARRPGKGIEWKRRRDAVLSFDEGSQTDLEIEHRYHFAARRVAERLPVGQ